MSSWDQNWSIMKQTAYYHMEAPMSRGKAHNWKALRRPTPSAIQPLAKHPRKAPARQVLTTKPVYYNINITHWIYRINKWQDLKFHDYLLAMYSHWNQDRQRLFQAVHWQLWEDHISIWNKRNIRKSMDTVAKWRFKDKPKMIAE